MFSTFGGNRSRNSAPSVNDVGGLLANVNRWRDQLGLPRLLAPALASETQSLDLSEGKATLVDFSGTDAKTGQPARLVGAIMTPRLKPTLT